MATPITHVTPQDLSKPDILSRKRPSPADTSQHLFSESLSAIILETWTKRLEQALQDAKEDGCPSPSNEAIETARYYVGLSARSGLRWAVGVATGANGALETVLANLEHQIRFTIAVSQSGAEIRIYETIRHQTSLVYRHWA